MKSEHQIKVTEADCHFKLLLVDNRLPLDLAEVELVDDRGGGDHGEGSELQTHRGSGQESIPVLQF